jgi:competence protein ComEA
MFKPSRLLYIAIAPLPALFDQGVDMKKWFVGLFASLLLSASALAAIDLNTATQSELESVKGIGPAKAKQIVEYRQKNGPFKNVDALAEVKGFGKASVAKFKNELVVGGDAKATGKK